MTSKEYLCRYLNLERRIHAKEDKIQELKQRATSLHMHMGTKVQSSKQVGGNGRIIDQYLDLENELVKDIKRLKIILKSISSTVKKLENDEQKEVLERKYINGESFSTISSKMNMCERQIYRIHGKALEQIDREIN